VKLTKGTDYGLRGILYLAKQPQGKVALVADIARSEGVPESYLAKIFQDLARGGVLVSHRGAKGGFSLVRSLREVSLLEVIQAIEGPIALQPCLDDRQGCDQIGMCVVSDVIRKAQTEMVRVLESTSLENLLEQTLAKKLATQ
jgi:Rrf2 family transcriptional regulator, iron-sulfur cluster assembly transcription factor